MYKENPTSCVQSRDVGYPNKKETAKTPPQNGTQKSVPNNRPLNEDFSSPQAPKKNKIRNKIY